MRFRILTAAAAAAVLLTSCGGLFEPVGGEVSEGASQASGEVSRPEKTPDGEDLGVLSIYVDDETLLVNTAGKPLLFGPNVSVLSDALTREPKYLSSQRFENEKRDTDGWITDANVFTTLYDLNGEIIRAEISGGYELVFGDFLIIGDYQNSRLERFSTGEVLKTGFSYGVPSEKYVALHDSEGNELVRIDRDGNFFEPGEELYIYSLSNTDYYVSYDNEQNLWGLLDADLNEVIPMLYENVSVTGDYALVQDQGSTRVLKLPECAEVLSTDERVTYFDGEVGIKCDWNYQFYWLTDVRGERISPYDYTVIYVSDVDMPNRAFTARTNDGAAVLLGRDGHEMLRRGNSEIYQIGNDAFVLSWYTETPEKDGGSRYTYYSTVVDSQANTLIPQGRYSWVYRTIFPGGTEILEGVKTGANNSVIDLLNPDFSVRISGLKSICSVSGNYLGVIQGFSMGVMDMDGNWIYKTSTFRTLEDE